jgi:uncharacterized membrane protein YczE
VAGRDLHAFVDGELDGEGYRAVVARLAADPDAAERVGDLLRQRGALLALREQLDDVDPPRNERTEALARGLADAVRRQRRVRRGLASSGLALTLVAGLWGASLYLPLVLALSPVVFGVALLIDRRLSSRQDQRSGARTDRRGAGSAGFTSRRAGGAWLRRSLLAGGPNGRPTSAVPEEPPGARRVGMYLAGCLLFSLGVKLFIDAGLGVDPLHAMLLGLARAVDLPFAGVGLLAALVTAGFLALWSAWTQRFPPLSTFLTMVLVGGLVDLWNLLGLERWTGAALAPTSMMLAGLLLDAYASALIIMAGIGIRVMDLVALAAARRHGCSFLTAKMVLEAGFFAAALALGGPIGPATVAFTCLVAPFIPSFMWANGRLLRLPNHGLAAGGSPAHG